MFRSEENIHCKPWLMRLYYQECAIFKRLMAGTGTDADIAVRLSYFEEAPALQKRAKLLKNAKATQRTTVSLSERLGLQRIAALSDPGEEAESPPDLPSFVRPPHLPGHIWLHIALIEFDLAMRFLIVGVYALVLLGAWRSREDVPADAFSCGELISYFADTSAA